MNESGRAHALGVALALVLALVLSAPVLDLVPLWDGRIYALCAQQLARGDLEGLRCAGHPTHAWSLWMSLAPRLAFGSAPLFHLGSLALFALLLDGTARVLRRALPGEDHRPLRLAALGAVAVHPALLATMLNTNPDLGVAAFAMAALGQLAERRWWVAAAAGCAAAFSKETGIAVYGLFALLVVAVEWRVLTPRARRSLVVLVLPVALAIGVAAARLLGGASTVWDGAATDGTGLVNISISPSDPFLHNALALIFVLGFGWLVTLPILADGFVALRAWARGAPARPLEGADATWAALVPAALLFGVAGLTSLRTYGNVRYYAPLYPLLVTTGAIALVRLGVPHRLRPVVTAVWIVTFGAAAWRSVDPVSRMVWGTFPVGPRPMYHMTSVTGECCGRGRDQLAYNLEFAFFHEAQNRIFAAVSPTPETVVIVPQGALWFLGAPLDPATRRRTMAWENVLLPRYLDDATLARTDPLPPEILVLAMPNLPFRPGSPVWARYEVVEQAEVAAFGHAMHAFRLRRRDDTKR